MRKPPRTKKLQRVSEALEGFLARAGLAERVAQAEVVVRWKDYVGEQIARAAVAESVTPDGTLYVKVKSSAWRQELSLMTPGIMAKLNAGKKKKGRVEKIFWVVGQGRKGSEGRRGSEGRDGG